MRERKQQCARPGCQAPRLSYQCYCRAHWNEYRRTYWRDRQTYRKHRRKSRLRIVTEVQTKRWQSRRSPDELTVTPERVAAALRAVCGKERDG